MASDETFPFCAQPDKDGIFLVFKPGLPCKGTGICFFQKKQQLIRDLYNKAYSTLGCILGSSDSGKMPYLAAQSLRLKF